MRADEKKIEKWEHRKEIKDEKKKIKSKTKFKINFQNFSGILKSTLVTLRRLKRDNFP